MEELDLSNNISDSLVEVPKKSIKNTKTKKETIITDNDKPLVSCLKNERVIVRYLNKRSGIWGNNPKHILAGGMAEGAAKVFVVPRLSSGLYVNILTDSEKSYLEEIMGLEYNALSIYKKVDNFWDDSNDNGINRVRLTKGDNYFDLSNPDDYIKYKILLANKDFIAPSIQAYQDAPKATYQFVIINEGDENKLARNNMSTTMLCYKEFGKIEDDFFTLKTIVELINNRPVSPKTKIEFLQTKINEIIQSDSKTFLRVATDPMLSTKVLIKRCIENGIISLRGNYLYLKSDNSPLCEQDEEPTLSVAARYLNSPRHQELLFLLQSKIK